MAPLDALLPAEPVALIPEPVPNLSFNDPGVTSLDYDLRPDIVSKAILSATETTGTTETTASEAVPSAEDTPDTSQDQEGDENVHDDADEDNDDALLQDDFKNNALTGTALTREIFPPYKTVFTLNGQQFTEDLTSHDPTRAKASLTFRMPDSQRSALVLRVTLPRDMNKEHNPGRIRTHGLFVYIPVPAIKTLTYEEFISGQPLPPGFTTRDGFLDYNGGPYPLAVLNVRATGAFVQAGSLPRLVDEALMTKANALVAAIRAGEIQITFLIRVRHDLTLNDFTEFSRRHTAELSDDPSLAWIQNSPNAQSFTMGNLVNSYDRPQIPVQRAETVFYDKLAYLVPMIYGTVYEDEFQELLSQEFRAATYTMTLIEAPNARKSAMSDPDSPDAPIEAEQAIQSTACIYIGFIDYNNLDLVRPGVGTRLKVHLDLPLENPTTEEGTEGQAKEDGSATAVGHEPPGDGEEEGTPHVEAYDPVAELGNDDLVDAFNDEDEDLTNQDINVWSATVIETTAVTPPGHVTIILERRRQPGWIGLPQLRPFVSAKLTVVNFALAQTTAELQTLIIAGPKMTVGLSIVYNKQGLKDMVRCADELWRGSNPQKGRICSALLGQNPDISPLARLNLHNLRGQHRFSTHFNPAQLGYYNSLCDTPEISLLHGPFGTGKTETCIATTAEIAASSTKQQILYLVETNKAVDEVALRFESLFLQAGLSIELIRLHSLPGEKKSVYPHFRTMQPPQDRFVDVTDDFVAELSLMAYLTKLGMDYQESRRRGDPRRVCTHLTLSKAMCDILEKSDREEWRRLRGMLLDYGQDGFFNTDPETRTMIKLALNDLMAFTIQQQRVIVCTLSAAAKVNLAANFDPVVVVLDEAARVAELKALIPFGQYSPRLFLWAGDHNQQLPYCESFGREKDTANPYLNPFGPQQLLSGFERMIRNGAEHTLLDLQHRCRGDIQEWVSDTFYHGRVREASRNAADDIAIQKMRDFCISQLGTSVPTNRYARNLNGSRAEREDGGQSLYNKEEVKAIIADLTLMSEDPDFKTKRVGILSFYKAQLAMLKQECSLLGIEVHFVDLTTLTVATAQGTEYDVVLLSLVATQRVTFINEPHALVVALTRARLLLGIYTNWNITSKIIKPNASNMFIASLLQDLVTKNHVIDSASSQLCFNCREAGHRKDDCPNPKIDQCRRCAENDDEENKWGHTAPNCTLYPRSISCARCREHQHPDAKTHNSKDCPHFKRPLAEVRCRECNEMGHRRADCPQVVCSNCKEKGHTFVCCNVPVLCSKCRLTGHFARNCTTVLTRAHLAQVRPMPTANNIRRQYQMSNIRDVKEAFIEPAEKVAVVVPGGNAWNNDDEGGAGW